MWVAPTDCSYRIIGRFTTGMRLSVLVRLLEIFSPPASVAPSLSRSSRQGGSLPPFADPARNLEVGSSACDRMSRSPPCVCKERRHKDGHPRKLALTTRSSLGIGMSGKAQWGVVCMVSGGLGGGVDDLSSLKMPAILPKRPFFFLGSSASCTFAACVGGGNTLGPPPKIRLKN